MSSISRWESPLSAALSLYAHPPSEAASVMRARIVAAYPDKLPTGVPPVVRRIPAAIRRCVEARGLPTRPEAVGRLS